jgi:tetratricopeptide (TPR) repeat protein
MVKTARTGEETETMDALRMWQHLVYENSPVAKKAVDDYRRALELGLDGRWDEAEAVLAQSLEPLEKAEAPQAASANHNLGVMHQERGDLDGAVFHAVRAVFLYNRRADLGGLYAALRNLAVIHTSRGETHLATASQHQAARARRELITRGLLTLAEGGCDAVGEPLKILSLSAALVVPQRDREAV